MSDKFTTVKHYYKTGLWDLDRVKDAVEHEWITADEYKEITGKVYA